MSITFKHKINCRKLKISGKFAQYVSNINLNALIISRTYFGRRPRLVWYFSFNYVIESVCYMGFIF